MAEAHKLAQPEEFDYLALLDDRYASVRKFARLLLTEFEFHAAPAAADLLQGLDLPRKLNATGQLRETAMAALCSCTQWRHRPALLRVVHTLGTPQSITRRRRVGIVLATMVS